MALPPSSQPEGEDYPANGRPSQDLDTTGRAHVGSLLNELSSPQTDCKLRAELKRHYHGLREAIFGQDMKYYWRSEGYMLKLVDKKPEIAMDRGLKQLCNKSTMLYWALVVVLDELLLSPPACRIDGTISLDDEIQRRTAVLILTGYGHGLSNTISFDAIKSEFLPLARDDVCACDSARTIRVSLKTAVQFIAELQQRENTAFSSLKQDTVNTILEPNTYGVFAVDRADEYVDDVLNNPLEDESKQSEINYARETIKMRERGEVSYEAEFDHWNSSWI